MATRPTGNSTRATPRGTSGTSRNPSERSTDWTPSNSPDDRQTPRFESLASTIDRKGKGPMEPLSTYTALFEDKRQVIEDQWGAERANAIIDGAAAYLRVLETKDHTRNPAGVIILRLSERAWRSAAIALGKAYPSAQGHDGAAQRDTLVGVSRRIVAVKVVEYGPKVPESWERVFDLSFLRGEAERWIARNAPADDESVRTFLEGRANGTDPGSAAIGGRAAAGLAGHPAARAPISVWKRIAEEVMS